MSSTLPVCSSTEWMARTGESTDCTVHLPRHCGPVSPVAQGSGAEGTVASVIA